MNSRGSILMTTLWAMSILSIISFNLTFHASNQMMVMKREREAFNRRLLYQSGMNEALLLIYENSDAYGDNAAHPWYGKIELPDPLKDKMSVWMEDEESKINLNEAGQSFLEAFLKKMEDGSHPLKGERKNYVKLIVEKRSLKKILSLEELLLMDSFEPEDYEQLKPYVTVAPDLPLININTASDLVLAALVESIPGDYMTKRLFMEKLTDQNSEASTKVTFIREDLTPQSFSQRLRLPQTPNMNSFVQQFLSYVTVDSENYRIKIETEGEGRAEGIFRYRADSMRPAFYYWHEN